MLCAANYAFVNRQVLTYQIRRAFEEVLSKEVNDHYLFQVYDIAHNIAKFETHLVNNKELQVCVHRKGATRAFGPGSTDLPLDFQRIGQPVLVPGSMGTSSWVLTGTEDAMHKSFGSCCHGAGRMMSRHHAKKSIRGDKLKNELADAGIIIRTGSLGGLAEEAPEAYKNVDQVIETVSGSGIAKKVARLRPVAVIKG
jgi:tRNA-splicing ligase RtcB